MTDIIKKIREIIGDHWSSELNIRIYPDKSIMFEIYESEVPILVNLEDGTAELYCEVCKSKLTADMLKELGEICKAIENNIDCLRDIFKE